MIDYTKLTKAQLIEMNKKLEEEILSLQEGSESNKKLFDKEVIKLKGLIETGEKEIISLKLNIDKLEKSPEKNNLRERVESLKNESFEKERIILGLRETIIKVEENLRETVIKKDAFFKENIDLKDKQINGMTQQLNGLSDLFNEIFLGLKDQNALLGVYSRNINNFQERIDAKIAQFNTPPTK